MVNHKIKYFLELSGKSAFLGALSFVFLCVNSTGTSFVSKAYAKSFDDICLKVPKNLSASENGQATLRNDFSTDNFKADILKIVRRDLGRRLDLNQIDKMDKDALLENLTNKAEASLKIILEGHSTSIDSRSSRIEMARISKQILQQLTLENAEILNLRRFQEDMSRHVDKLPGAIDSPLRKLYDRVFPFLLDHVLQMTGNGDPGAAVSLPITSNLFRRAHSPGSSSRPLKSALESEVLAGDASRSDVDISKDVIEKASVAISLEARRDITEASKVFEGSRLKMLPRQVPIFDRALNALLKRERKRIWAATKDILNESERDKKRSELLISFSKDAEPHFIDAVDLEWANGSFPYSPVGIKEQNEKIADYVVSKVRPAKSVQEKLTRKEQEPTEAKRDSDKQDVQSLWDNYFSSEKSLEAEKFLVENYLQLSRNYGFRMFFKWLKGTLDWEDAASLASLGLIEAIRTYDPTKSSFETYAYLNIRRVILEEVRSNDLVPPKTRSRSKKVDEFKNDFFAEFGEKPSDEQINEFILSEFGIKYQGRQTNGSIPFLRSIFTNRNQAAASGALISDKSVQAKLTFDIEKVLKNILGRLPDVLSKTELTYIRLRYKEGASYAEAAEQLGITKDEAHALESKIFRHLRWVFSEATDIEP